VGCGDIDECGAGGGLNDCQNIATAGGFADSFTCSNTIGFVLKIHVIDQVFLDRVFWLMTGYFWTTVLLRVEESSKLDKRKLYL